ncbi:hypothetical protein [Halospeciosus flavus]|uniref:Uncharacterized protein n=1 Tax=Halospeciosus flavus TaxID=3032283 RepID=A0ABD5Z3Z6_9EURY|nr:hypothetical protein [Halospeciosus flavus]
MSSQTNVAIALDDASVQSGTNVTATAYGVQGDSVTFQLDADNDGTFDRTWTVAANDSTVRTTFDPSDYRQTQGTFWITAEGTTSSAYGEIDDTSPSAAVTTNTADHQVEVDVTAWDALDNDWERLQTLEASLTGPMNTTLTLADFTERSDRGTNGTHYTTTIDVGTDGRYTLHLSNVTDTAGNPAGETVTAAFIVDTNPPNVWNGSAVDTTNRNRVVDDGDTVTVTANVSDRFLNRVWVDATALGADNVTLSKVNGTESYYRGTVTIDAQHAAADGTHALTIWADDAGQNVNQTTTDPLTLDTTAPSFATEHPSPGTFTDDRTQSVSVAIRDRSAVSGTIELADASGTLLDGTFENTSGVTLQDGTVIVDTSEAIADGTFADGPVNVTVSATDAEGHTNTTSWHVTVDTVAPTITNTTVADADENGIVGNGDNVTVAATVTDAHLGEGGVTLNASAFGAGMVVMSPAETGRHRYTATVTVNVASNVSTQRDLSIHAIDRAGNVNTTGAGTLHLDTVAPELPTGVRGSPINISNQYAYPLTVTLPEDHQNETVAIRLSNGNTTITTSTTVEADAETAQVTVDAHSLPQGHVTVAAKVIDPAMNVNAGGWTTLDTVLKDTVRPRASSAHAVAGTQTISVPVSEHLPERDYTALDLEYTGPQSIESVTLSQPNILSVRLSSAVTESQLSNPNVTIGLDEDTTDRAGNQAVDDGGVMLTPSHYFSGTVTYDDDGRDASGVTVTATYDGEVIASTTTNWAGRYGLQISDPDFSTDDEIITLTVKDVSKRYQWNAGATTTADFVIASPVTSEGDTDDNDVDVSAVTAATTQSTTTTTQTTRTTRTQTTQTTQTQSTSTTSSTSTTTEEAGLQYIAAGNWTTSFGLLLLTLFVGLGALAGWRYWRQNQEDEPPRL